MVDSNVKAMPTLLQISIEANVCSVGRIEQQIGDLAIANGWQSYMTYSRGYKPGASKAIRIGSKPDVYWHVLMTRLFDRHCLHSKDATKKLVEQIKEINPDIIHIHQIHGYFLNIEVLFTFLKRYGKPIVWTFHDCWAFTGHCAHFDKVGCEKWKSGCYDCPLKSEYPSSYIDRSEKNYKFKKELFTNIPKLHIVTVSKWLQQLVEESFFKSYVIQTIYNGVDVSIFHPRQNIDVVKLFKLEGKRILLAAATTWTEDKGLKDYFQLRKVLSNDNVIVLVGLTEDQIKALPAGIVGIRRTNSQYELAELYSAADITLNLSYLETFGLTTAEGLACGTPGIVYNKTASPELITPETGRIVEAGDIKGLSDAIEEILSKGKSNYSDKCRERAVEYYDKDKQYRKYLDLYENLIMQ